MLELEIVQMVLKKVSKIWMNRREETVKQWEQILLSHTHARSYDHRWEWAKMANKLIGNRWRFRESNLIDWNRFFLGVYICMCARWSKKTWSSFILHIDIHLWSTLNHLCSDHASRSQPNIRSHFNIIRIYKWMFDF